MAEAGEALELQLDEAGVQGLGAVVARHAGPPLVIHLEGELGAGKTTLARALIQALGHGGRVKSPTYGLLEHYQLDALQVLHLDLYRLRETGELEFLGLADLLDDSTLLLVEWPDHGGPHLPSADIRINLRGSGSQRRLRIAPHTAAGRAICARVAADYQ